MLLQSNNRYVAFWHNVIALINTAMHLVYNIGMRTFLLFDCNFHGFAVLTKNIVESIFIVQHSTKYIYDLRKML